MTDLKRLEREHVDRNEFYASWLARWKWRAPVRAFTEAKVLDALAQSAPFYAELEEGTR